MNPLEIQGWMTPDELDWLTKTAASKNLIIEIGTWKGRSTAALCNGCPGRVISIDSYTGSPIDTSSYKELDTVNVLEIAKNNLKEYIDSNKLILLKDKPYFSTKQVDMVFIDGDHEYTAVMDDILYSLRVLRSKGLISGHDINLTGVARAVRTIFGTEISIHEGSSIWYKEI